MLLRQSGSMVDKGKDIGGKKLYVRAPALWIFSHSFTPEIFNISCIHVFIYESLMLRLFVW